MALEPVLRPPLDIECILIIQRIHYLHKGGYVFMSVRWLICLSATARLLVKLLSGFFLEMLGWGLVTQEIVITQFLSDLKLSDSSDDY